MRPGSEGQSAFAAVLFLIADAFSAQPLTGGQSIIDEWTCAELNDIVMAEVVGPGTCSALSRLAPALSTGASRSDRACAGLILANIAGFMSVAERHFDAEAFARRSVDVLDSTVPADDPLLLSPLHKLARAAACRTQGHRRTVVGFERSGQELPWQRAVVEQIAATLLEAEGHRREADSGYLSALAAWEHSGGSGEMEASDLLAALGAVSLAHGRLRDAESYSNRALAIARSSKAAMPPDLVKLLNARVVVYTRQQAYVAAEADFREALSTAESHTNADVPC